MSSVQLSHLPSEVLEQIVDYAIPTRRLAAQRPNDVEWLIWDPRKEGDREWSFLGPGKELPSLLFVNKRLSDLATILFYSKATLEITPIKPSQYILDARDHGIGLDLSDPLTRLHVFCPAASLRRIERVHMFSRQSDAINAESYEATMRWLVQHTSVKAIYLSRRLMTRVRNARIDLSSALLALIERKVVLVRTVNIYARHFRSHWEKTRMSEMTKASGVEPPALQMYYYQQGSSIDPILDPRWDARLSDGSAHRVDIEPFVGCLDTLAGNDAACQLAKSSWEKWTGFPTYWLYQVCFIVRTS